MSSQSADETKLAGCLELWAFGLGAIGVLGGIALIGMGRENRFDGAGLFLADLLLASVLSYAAASSFESRTAARVPLLVLAGAFSFWLIPVGPVVTFWIFRYVGRPLHASITDAARVDVEDPELDLEE